MAFPKLPFFRYTSGRQLIGGSHINGLGDLLTGTISPAVARAGGGQALALQITSAFIELTTVATAADSVALPPAKSGIRVCITNSGANSAQVFGALGFTDTVQGAAGNVGQAIAAGATAMFICTKDGVWTRFVSA
jgi:hypothetical protein